MSKNRLLQRRSSIGIRPKWGTQCVEPDQLTDVSTMITKPLPVGQSPDAVQLYGYHDIYGTIDFNGSADLQQFPATISKALKIDTANGYLIPGEDFTTAAFPGFQPEALDTYWDQPLDATQIVSIRVPFFKVNVETSTYQILTIRFNWGGDKGGGDNYAQLKITPDTTTGSPNQNNLDFTLTYYNYGALQDTDTYSGLRKYPDYTGDDLGYELQFWLDDSTNRAYVKIIPDEGAEDTLYVTSPTDLTYCDTHSWHIYSFWNDVTKVETAIDWFRILKEASEDDRVIYKISRDGGTNWVSVIGDDWFVSGYNTTSVDFTGGSPPLPAGNGNLLLKIELRWPAIVKGYGMALGG
jgi:hypothetical protein